MTKGEAYLAMKNGSKITHRYYDSNEFVFINKNGVIETEDGYTHGNEFNAFWKEIQKWEDGWSVYKQI